MKASWEAKAASGQASQRSKLHELHRAVHGDLSAETIRNLHNVSSEHISGNFNHFPLLVCLPLPLVKKVLTVPTTCNL